MIKLTASYGKKVPAETEYSSKSYHAQIEVEIPDGLSSQQLHEKVHGVFSFVRDSVEAELQCAAPPEPQIQNMQQAPQIPQPQAQPMPPMPSQAAQQAMPANGGYAAQPQQAAYLPQSQGGDPPATRKQVNYLLSLVKRAGWTVQQLLQHCNVSSVEQITSRACSQLIQQFSGQAA